MEQVKETLNIVFFQGISMDLIDMLLFKKKNLSVIMTLCFLSGTWLLINQNIKFSKNKKTKEGKGNASGDLSLYYKVEFEC